MRDAPEPGGTPPSDATLIEARELSVDASWGHICGPVDLRVRTGGVTVLAGPEGRGRTALLLTLAGRMRPTKGELVAFDRSNDAHHLFKNAAVAWIDEVDDIEQTIRVSDVITEQIRWSAPWYKWVTPALEEDLERICRPVFGPYPLPAMESFVEELPRTDRCPLPYRGGQPATSAAAGRRRGGGQPDAKPEPASPDGPSRGPGPHPDRDHRRHQRRVPPGRRCP